MAHLTNSELADATEPEVGPRLTTHLAACEQCRGRVEGLAAARATAAGVEEPEPSPLFWSAFAERVGAAVREAEAAGTARGNRRAVPVWTRVAATAAAVLLVVSAVAVFFNRAPGPPTGVSEMTAGVQEAPDSTLASAGDADPGQTTGDAAWQVVAEMGAEVGWDEASEAGLGPEPGSAVSAVEDLTESERAELARLLGQVIAGEPF